MRSESVAIVGGGIAGLALAQRLVAAGLDCRVYERDNTLDRPVRIHCRPLLEEAMRDCVPAAVFEEFLACQGVPDARHVHADGALAVRAVEERPEPELVLDTATTREVLALGLGHRLELGREVVTIRFEGGRTALAFADGDTVEVDLVVGADGFASTARRFTSDAPDVHEAPVTSIHGTAPLGAVEVPGWLDGAFGIVSAGEVDVAVGLYEPRRPARAASVAARSYLFWNVLGNPGTLRAVTTPSQVVPLVEAESPWLAALVGRSRGARRFNLQTSSRAHAPDAPDGLLLIGDAAHPMLPAALSTAAAVEDARLLGSALTDGTGTLRQRASGAKEKLLDQAFARVREAELVAAAALGITGTPT